MQNISYEHLQQLKSRAKTAKSNLSQSPSLPLLRFRKNLLDSDHLPVLSGATQHDARASRANKLAGSKVFRQNEAVLRK
jgi:hypothetical protein